MSLSISFLNSSRSLSLPPPHALSPPPPSSISLLRRLTPGHLSFNLRHHPGRFATAAAATERQDTVGWTRAPLVEVEPAAESLFHVSIDVSGENNLVTSYKHAGQYVELRVPNKEEPTSFAIASPPLLASEKGVFQFLVKSVEGSIAELLCGLKKGDFVQLSEAMGKGFAVDQLEPPEDYPNVFIFAAGSAISPIRSLIESGFGASKRSDVRLYYGARNLKGMAYQDKFKGWEDSGVKVVPVLSQPEGDWDGKRGHVQGVFRDEKIDFGPRSTGAILCGGGNMIEEVTSIFVEKGVSREKILTNF